MEVSFPLAYEGNSAKGGDWNCKGNFLKVLYFTCSFLSGFYPSMFWYPNFVKFKLEIQYFPETSQFFGPPKKKIWEKKTLIPVLGSLCLNNNDRYIYIYQGSLFFLIVISSDFLIASPCYFAKRIWETLEKNLFLYGVKLVFFQQKFATFAKSKKIEHWTSLSNEPAVMIVSSENGQ